LPSIAGIAAAHLSALDGKLLPWIQIAQASLWPLVVIAAIFIYRRPLASFLEGMGQRITKISAFKFEFELSKLPEARPWAGPSLEELQEPQSRWLFDSGGFLYSEIEILGR
jgi:hypothetical protein